MKLRKALFVIIPFFLLAKAISFLLSYYVSSTTPPLVEKTEQSFKNNNDALSKIGTYEGFETKYNENDFKDSVANFSVTIIGSRKRATLKAKARRSLNNDWYIYKADTIYTQ